MLRLIDFQSGAAKPFIMRQVEELSRREIAVRMGIAEKTVKRHLNDAVRTLADILYGEPRTSEETVSEHTKSAAKARSAASRQARGGLAVERRDCEAGPTDDQAELETWLNQALHIALPSSALKRAGDGPSGSRALRSRSKMTPRTHRNWRRYLKRRRRPRLAVIQPGSVAAYLSSSRATTPYATTSAVAKH